MTDRGPQVAGTSSFFLIITTISIALRLYCRLCVVKSFGIDDWFCVAAWVFFVFFCGFSLTGVVYGTGKHVVDIIPASNVPIGLKWWWACEPVFVLSNMCLKASICVFLLRLTIYRLQKALIYTVLLVVELYGVIFFFIFVLQCSPPKYFWEQYTGGKGTCMDNAIIVKTAYAYSAISCWGDWVLAVLPVFLVWKLQMNPRTKLVVSMILAMGGIASTATIVRLPYIRSYADKDDFLYATTDVAIWSAAENGIGITVACLATLRPLFKKFFERTMLWGGSGQASQGKSWKNSGYPNSGYLKSDGSVLGGIAMRNDIRKAGVTTTIDGGEDGEGLDLESRHEKGHSQWRTENSSDAGSADRHSEEKHDRWGGGGIVATTVTTIREDAL